MSKTSACLNPNVNEFYLFHGTTPDAVNLIHKQGFRIDLAGSNAGKAFGNGAYFAECSSKSDEYAQDDRNNIHLRGVYGMLLCRVVCGNMKKLEQFDQSAHRFVQSPSPPNYDSVLGDREAAAGTYREFIVYEETQIYPEFIILYERRFR
jgi:hypothetical protein